MNPDIGIAEKNLRVTANELQKLLADEYVLYTKTRNYHWNVEGPNFMEMHKFYEGQYVQLDEIIDEVAERIGKIGHFSEARLKDFLEFARLDEAGYTYDQTKQLKNLLSDHETIIKVLRKNITEFPDEYKDLGSSDFVTGLLQKHEMMAWFIRSYLK
jgi:starvation-inducible DNA-binding protein